MNPKMTKTNIKGIAFDLEGTVIDVEAAHHNGHLAAAEEFGLALTLDEAYDKIGHFIGGPDEKVCEDIRNLLCPESQNKFTVDDILRRDKFHYERLLAEMPVEPRPGFIQFFKAARKKGLRLAVGSVTSYSQTMILLKQSGLDKLFESKNIVLREHVLNLKPAPDVFLKTAEIMGISPDNQLVFEDSPRGVKAALAAGSKAIGTRVVIRGSTVAALVDAGVSRIFFGWRDINLSALLKNL